MLYHNNGDGTFTDVTAKAGVADGRWSTGASFGDYDGDGLVDLMVTNYVDFHLNDLPGFGSAPNCKYRGISVQCGPRGLRGAGDSLFHNNGDGTFTDVSKAAGVSDPDGLLRHGRDLGGLQQHRAPGHLRCQRLDAEVPLQEPRRTASSRTSVCSRARRSAKTARSRLRWGLRSATTTTRDGLRFTSRTSRTRTTCCIATTAIGISRRSPTPAGVALPSLPWVKWGTAFVDLDNDGWLDLIAVSGHVYPQVDSLPSGPGYREPKLLNMNQKDGTFCDASDQAGPALTEKRVSTRTGSRRSLQRRQHGRRDRRHRRGADDSQEPWGAGAALGQLRAGRRTEEQPAGAQRPAQDRGRRRYPDRRDPQRRQLSLAERSARPLRAGRGDEDRQPGDPLAIGQGGDSD